MLFWAGCRFVAESAFLDFHEVEPDFKTFVETNLDATTFIPADKKDELPLIIPAQFISGQTVRRMNQNVLSVSMAVLDLDSGSAADQQLVLGIVKQYGHFVHTSFSHDAAGQHKHRAFVKLSRPVDVTEWKGFFPRMLAHFRAQGIADKKCSDPCHMYFVPGGDPARYVAYGADGPGLDVDLALSQPLPEGFEEAKLENYQDIVPEEERAAIGDGLRDLWNARLSNLVDAIEARPYPGSIYDLKVHEVFGLARGCPHIMDAERLQKSIVIAMKRRYQRAMGEAAEMVPVYLEKSLEQIDKAIEDGMGQPWWPPLVNEVVARPLTEFGLAERLVDNHRQDIRWEPTWKSWLGWNGKYWTLEAGLEVVRYKMFQTIRAVPREAQAYYHDYLIAKEHYKSVVEDANANETVKVEAEFKFKEIEEKIQNIRSFAVKSETYSKWAHAVTLASTLPKILTDFRAFNRDPWSLNFRNGTVNLRSGDFREHQREDFITRIVPCDYYPDAECPRFDLFMRQFMGGNERMINFLWRALGYAACGVTSEQKIFILYGDGANGKSTFLNLMLEIFGQGSTGYGLAVNSENLLSARGSSKHETWRMSLANVRMVGGQEVDEGRTFAESLIKELTGGDIITGRKLYQDEWSYRPEFSPWLAVNHLPHVRGTDEGIWRRLCVIPCDASFKDKPDRALPQRLLQEAPGIWARLVREAQLWTKEGLVLPPEVLTANTLYREQQDSLGEFLERYCVREAQAHATKSELWAAYELYCEGSRTRTFHRSSVFYGALGKQFSWRRGAGELKDTRQFYGVRLKNPKEFHESSPRQILLRTATGGHRDGDGGDES